MHIWNISNFEVRVLIYRAWFCAETVSTKFCHASEDVIYIVYRHIYYIHLLMHGMGFHFMFKYFYGTYKIMLYKDSPFFPPRVTSKDLRRRPNIVMNENSPCSSLSPFLFIISFFFSYALSSEPYLSICMLQRV